jgi:hypothetical protein
MKKQMIVAAATVAGAGIGLALWRMFRKKRNAGENGMPHTNTHHLTNTFANAKKHAKLQSLPTLKEV